MVKHRPCCIPGIKLPEALKGMFMEMEDRMVLRKAEGEDRSWSDSNGDPSIHCKILTDYR